MDTSPVGYPGDSLDPQSHHRPRTVGQTPAGYPVQPTDPQARRKAAPSSARMEVGSTPVAATASRGSAGTLSEAQSARRRNHTKSIGHYILGKTIGEGTFGKVKLGTHILTGEKVAVKVLEKERIIDVADVERVAREVYILKLIRHQHVVQLYEIIETSRQLYLIMEYASGGELFDYIVSSGRIQEPEACRFFKQIVAGMEEIHKMNVVHRDLKPENLLLDEHCDIKIVDFGLSNTYRDGQLLKTACGSPCYAAPEMIAGKEYVPSLCDVWSCGVILFAMLCGYLPFEDQNTAVLYRKILAAEYTLPDFLSQSAREIISGMLTTDPTRRLTASSLGQLPWMQQGSQDDSTARNKNSDMRYFEEDILEELEKFGFPPDYTQRCLRMNKHNHVTTTYHLLERKKQRMMDQFNLDQAHQEQFGLNGLDQASQALGSSIRVGGYDGQNFAASDAQDSPQDYSIGNSPARGVPGNHVVAPTTDAPSSARGPAQPQQGGNYNTTPRGTRRTNSPAHGSSAVGGAPVGSSQQGAAWAPQGPPSPRTSARAGSQPAQPRWAARTAAPTVPPGTVSPQAFRSDSVTNNSAATNGSTAAPSRRPRGEITTPRGVRRPSQDRLPAKGTVADAHPGPSSLGPGERERDRSAQHDRDRSAHVDDRPGPGTPNAGSGIAVGPQANNDQQRSARTSFGTNGQPAVSSARGIGSPGTGGQNRSGRLPSPPRYSSRGSPALGQPPSARPLTTANTTSAAARGSIPVSSARGGGSHSLSTRAAYSMTARSQTPPQASANGQGDSRNHTPSRSSTTAVQKPAPKSSPSPSQTEMSLQQPQPQYPSQQLLQPLTQPSPRQPQLVSQGSAQPVGGVQQQQSAGSTQPPPSATPPPQQSIPGTPPQVYQPPVREPSGSSMSGPSQPGVPVQSSASGQSPLAGGAPPGSTAAALAALRARRPYGIGPDGNVLTPRSEANTPRGQVPTPGMGSSGSSSARGPTPQVGQPMPQQHGVPRWPAAAATSSTPEPGRTTPSNIDRPGTGDRSQPDRQYSQDRPMSSRVSPTSDLGVSVPNTFAPLSARGASDAIAAPLSSREAREDRRAAFDTLRTSSRPPRLIMQELQRVLAAQRVASKQVSPLTLRCQWLSLKFDVEVAPLDRLGSIHAVRSRRTNGEPWQYKDVCNRLLAELRIA